MTLPSNQRILGACGLTAAMLGTAAGAVGSVWPRVGMVMSGAASAVMLLANLCLLLRRADHERK